MIGIIGDLWAVAFHLGAQRSRHGSVGLLLHSQSDPMALNHWHRGADRSRLTLLACGGSKDGSRREVKALG